MDHTLLARLDKLESVNSRLHTKINAIYFAGVAALLLAFGTGYATSTSFDTLRVKELIVEDKTGNTRVSISASVNDEVIQRFFDSAGTERIRHGVLKDGTSRHRLFNEKGEIGISSSVFSTKSSHKTIGITAYEGGKPLAGLGIYFDEEKSSFISNFTLNNPSTGAVSWKTESNDLGNTATLYDFSATENNSVYPAWYASSDVDYNSTSLSRDGARRWLAQINKTGENEDVVETGTVRKSNNWATKQSNNADVAAIQVYDRNRVRTSSFVQADGIATHRVLENDGQLAAGMFSLAGQNTLDVFYDGESRFSANSSLTSSLINLFNSDEKYVFSVDQNDNEIVNYQSLTPTQKAEKWANRALNAKDVLGVIFGGESDSSQ